METNSYDEIVNKINNLKISNNEVAAEIGFKKYNGGTNDVKEFLNQFLPYISSWGEDKTFAILENKLEGVALNWYRGAKGYLFESWDGLVKEITEMFGPRKKKIIKSTYYVI
ncbi:MAG: hypothetical protein RR557_08355 [Bacilli bacterium]